MKDRIKNFLKYKLLLVWQIFSSKMFKKINGHNNIIEINGKFSNITFDIIGNENEIIIKKNSCVYNCLIYIRGNNHKIVVEEEVVIYKGELWVEDQQSEIFIGRATAIQNAHIAATERGKIIIGSDCLLSTDIEIRTGDSHSIIDVASGNRINFAEDVILEPHVWIGSRVSILKGVTIGTNTVIGTGSIVTKSIPSASLAAGIPAKVIKTDINWIKEKI